jgi:hemolysin D
MPSGFAIMATTAEIKTGSRRTISYLLFPLLRYKQEALRER